MDFEDLKPFVETTEIPKRLTDSDNEEEKDSEYVVL